MSNDFVDSVDSFYRFSKSRIIAYNPNRIVVGVVNAQDWPPKDLTMEAFYLLYLGDDVVGKQGWSAVVPIKFHLVQWTWIIKGSDLQQGTRAAFRGDRYRKMQAMKYELTQGMVPQYTEKLTWSLDSNGNLQSASYSPKMFVTWTPPSFHEKTDTDSGVAYGTGSTRIQDIFQPITS